MDIREVLSVFKEASGAREAGLCPGVPTQSGKAPGPKSPLFGMRCLIVGVFPYYCGSTPGNLCLYARGKDYHEALSARLARAVDALQAAWPERRFVCGCDASPVNEVKAAGLAGLGVIGDNGLFLSNTYGSFVFLGTVAADADLPEAEEKTVAECLHCGACSAACPTGVLARGGNMREECLSAITQKKGALSAEEKVLMRRTGMAWGCDACQLCCPYNRRAKIDPMPEFRRDLLSDLPEELLHSDEKETERILQGRAFAWRGAEVLRRNLRILRGEE